MTHEFKNMDMKDAEVWFCPYFFASEHDTWYELIDTSVLWEQFQVVVYGKKLDQPRDSFYMSDNGYPYKYSGIDRKPSDWSVSVTEMKYIMDEAVQSVQPGHPKLNGCLGNRYKNGHQYIGAHSDNEGDLNDNAFIVSVSLGAPRDFVFTHKKTKEKVKILLTPGSVLLMGKGCQENWKHELPKRLKVKDPRINLTFRSIVSRNKEPDSDTDNKAHHKLFIYTRHMKDEDEPTLILESKSVKGLKKKYLAYLTDHREDEDYLEDDIWEKCVENYVNDIEKSEAPEFNCAYITKFL